MPSKDIIRAIGITENNLPPHLRKRRIARNQNNSNSNTQTQTTDSKSVGIFPIYCGETIEANQFIHIGTDGKAYNPNTTNKPATAFALAGADTDVEITAIISGLTKIVSSSADVGKRLYLSNSYPFYSITPTLATDKLYQIVGSIKSDNDLIITIEPAELKL